MRLVLILLTFVAILGHRPPASNLSAPVEAEEVWKLTLPEAIRIGLDEPCKVEADGSWWIGATKIPLGGFEPYADGKGPLSDLYDPEASKP